MKHAYGPFLGAHLIVEIMYDHCTWDMWTILTRHGNVIWCVWDAMVKFAMSVTSLPSCQKKHIALTWRLGLPCHWQVCRHIALTCRLAWFTMSLTSLPSHCFDMAACLVYHGSKMLVAEMKQRGDKYLRPNFVFLLFLVFCISWYIFLSWSSISCISLCFHVLYFALK